MILYNVTIKIDAIIEDEWVKWMKETHIPDVMRTGMFVENKMLKLLEQDESDGITYAMQYLCKNMSDYRTYQEKFAPALQRDVLEKFPEKFVAFRTIMEVL